MSNAYHTHIDKCQRCANQPFNLCDEGSRLLEAEAIGAVATPWKTLALAHTLVDFAKKDRQRLMELLRRDDEDSDA